MTNPIAENGDLLIEAVFKAAGIEVMADSVFGDYFPQVMCDPHVDTEALLSTFPNVREIFYSSASAYKDQSKRELAMGLQCLHVHLTKSDVLALIRRSRIESNIKPEKADRADYLERTWQAIVDQYARDCAEIKKLSSLVQLTENGSGSMAIDHKIPEQKMLSPVGSLSGEDFTVNYLVEGILETKTLSLWYGQSGVFKSFVAIDLAACVSTETPWHGYAIESSCAVAYLAGEGRKAVKKRIAAWCEVNNVSRLDNLLLLEGYFSLKGSQRIQQLAEEIKQFHRETGVLVGLVIIDTLSSFGNGIDENSNIDVAKTLSDLNNMLVEKLGCAVILIHHVGHSEQGRPRGAYVLKGNTDAVVQVNRADTPKGFGVELNFLKMKDGETPQSIRLSVERHTLSVLDAKGRAITSLVVGDRLADVPLVDLGVGASGLNRIQQAAYDLLLELSGTGNAAVKRADWLEACVQRGVISADLAESTQMDKIKNLRVQLIKSGHATAGFAQGVLLPVRFDVLPNGRRCIDGDFYDV